LQPAIVLPRSKPDFNGAKKQNGEPVHTVASTDLLPENDRIPGIMSRSKSRPAALRFSPPEARKSRASKTLLRPGIAGAAVGLAAGVLGFWLTGFGTPAENGGITVERKGSSETTLEAGGRKLIDEWDGFEPYFRQANKLAESQRYAPAAESLRTALKAQENTRSQHGAEAAQERLASAKDVQANCGQLEALWMREQGLADEGHLNSRQRDPVVALNSVLEGHKQSRESLHSLAASLGAKPTHSAPAIFVRHEMERLKNAKHLAEQEAARLGQMLENAGVVKRLAEETSIKLHAAQARLSTRERELREAEHKIKELLAAKAAMPAKTTTPQPPENRAIRRDPTLAYQHYTQGVALYQEGRNSEAEIELYWAIKRDSDDARYQYFLGLAQQAQGKRDLAAQNFRRGVQLEQGHQPSPVFVALALERAKQDGLQVLNTYRR